MNFFELFYSKLNDIDEGVVKINIGFIVTGWPIAVGLEEIAAVSFVQSEMSFLAFVHSLFLRNN